MDLWTHIVSFIAGLGVGWTLKVVISTRSSRTKRTNFVLQKGNSAHGDVVAGDVQKNRRG